MNLNHLCILIFGFCSIGLSSASDIYKERNEQVDKMRLDKNGYDKMKTIHYNWYVHSIKAIIGQLGKDVYEKLNKANRKELFHCLDQIKDKKDIVLSSVCLIQAKDNLQNQPTVPQVPETPRNEVVVNSFKQEVLQTSSIKMNSKKLELQKKEVKIQNLRSKPSRSSSKKTMPTIQVNKIKKLQKRYKKLLNKKRMNKVKKPSAYFFNRRVKRSPYRLITDSISKSDSDGYFVKKMDTVPYLKLAERSPIDKFATMIRSLVFQNKKNEKREKWLDSYQKLLDVKKNMDVRAKEKGAKIYDMRMLDLVLGRDEPSDMKNTKDLLPPIVKEAYNLISTIDKSKGSLKKNANIKFLSPRFASVMPDKTDTKGSLSPSILPFYNDDTEQQILPIPKLLEASGLQGKDRETVLELIMDISGARDTIDDALKVLKNMNFFGLEGELLEVTDRIEKNFKQLQESFNSLQHTDMDKRGFTFLESNQIQDIYSKQGMSVDSDPSFNLTEYGQQTNEQREEALWERVRLIASNSSLVSRAKRQIHVLAPTVLSPYMFAPVYGLSILGPTVLSPSLFSPLILNPAVLSPYVLSPAVGMPFILSPYVLSPYVLSPLVFAPFILTPYVLSPNVINPYVLSPLILSPLVLCPDVLSPMVLGGAILSPGVASPAVLSKSVLMASVLSPTILS